MIAYDFFFEFLNVRAFYPWISIEFIISLLFLLSGKKIINEIMELYWWVDERRKRRQLLKEGRKGDQMQNNFFVFHFLSLFLVVNRIDFFSFHKLYINVVTVYAINVTNGFSTIIFFSHFSFGFLQICYFQKYIQNDFHSQ